MRYAKRLVLAYWGLVGFLFLLMMLAPLYTGQWNSRSDTGCRKVSGLQDCQGHYRHSTSISIKITSQE